MKKIAIYQSLLLALCSFFSITSLAWDHAIDIGYGISHDPNHSRYNNSGILLTGDLVPLKITPSMHWSLTGAVGRWYSSAPVNKNLTTAALSVALRYYPFPELCYPGYFLGSVGPAYLSDRRLGYNTQAGNLTFQWNLGLGAEFDQYDVNLRIAHFSNAYIATPDQGFSVLYLLSVGYLF